MHHSSNTTKRWLVWLALPLTLFLLLARGAEAAPLTIGYSDWPGWVAWQVAIDKGWFKQAGLDVKFEWFDYSASMDAFAAGRLDAVTVTNGDQLAMGASGAQSKAILITDYSNGNDMIVGRPGIRSLKDLKGRKVGLEVGLVEHLLLLNGLQKAGIKDTDITLINTKTNETPQVLASGDVAAIGAWQPVAGQAMQQVPGSHPIYTSASAPGLIFDVLAVNPASLSMHRAEWRKVVRVWYRVVRYIHDPKTQPDAIRIMAARVGLTPAQYRPLLAGTKILTLAEAKKAYVPGNTLRSLYGSSGIVNQFNVKYGIYKQPQDIKSYLDGSLTNGL